MATEGELKKEIESILRTKWVRREGRQVPDTDNVKLGNDAVELEATVLYADLKDSTGLVDGYHDWFAAAVYKVFLATACRIIHDNNGSVTAFDGDRVMAVYIGDSKNTSAARTALRLNYAVTKLINPTIKQIYTTTNLQVQHCVGIDTSSLFVARTGIRGSNDLVWVGRAANYAAKLAELRSGNFVSFITADAYSLLHDSAKNGGEPRRSMWEKVMWQEKGTEIYRSSWWWKID
jgi:class 3 adenylate cyclase